MTLDAQAVADAFDLGRAESLSEPVARGELGQVRRLVTDRGAWAVKESFEPFDAEELAAAEVSGRFHAACCEAGIPTPAPQTSDGRFVVEVGGEQLQAYTWVDLADPDPLLDPAAVGALVAALHGVRHGPRRRRARVVRGARSGSASGGPCSRPRAVPERRSPTAWRRCCRTCWRSSRS